MFEFLSLRGRPVGLGRVVLASLVLTAAACDDDEGPSGEFADAYVLATNVAVADDFVTYAIPLSHLGTQTIDLSRANEFAGWTDVRAHDGNVFAADGETLSIARYAIARDGTFERTGIVGFSNYGPPYVDSAFVSPTKAYAFGSDMIVWDPTTMAIEGTFARPVLDDLEGGMEFVGITPGRSHAVRGDRVFFASHWANWDDYALSDDSVIVVLDAANDQLLSTISVPCPNLDVAAVAQDGTVYFSNWIYSVGQTLVSGTRKACAVQILPGQDVVDPSWSLTFADVTGGHEGAALRMLGEGKALFAVFHEERLDPQSDVPPAELADEENWGFDVLDLATQQAVPVTGIPWHTGWFSVSEVDGRTFVLTQRVDFSSTSVFEVFEDAHAELRFTVDGYATTLKRVR